MTENYFKLYHNDISDSLLNMLYGYVIVRYQRNIFNGKAPPLKIG